MPPLRANPVQSAPAGLHALSEQWGTPLRETPAWL
jgi:hypothetical protein